MTPIKRIKRQKFVYCFFSRAKIVIITMSSSDIV